MLLGAVNGGCFKNPNLPAMPPNMDGPTMLKNSFSAPFLALIIVVLPHIPDGITFHGKIFHRKIHTIIIKDFTLYTVLLHPAAPMTCHFFSRMNKTTLMIILTRMPQ